MSFRVNAMNVLETPVSSATTVAVLSFVVVEGKLKNFTPVLPPSYETN